MHVSIYPGDLPVSFARSNLHSQNTFAKKSRKESTSKLYKYIIWENVKDSLRQYTKNLHDYEKWKLEDQSGLFYHTVHLSDTRAIIFTNYFNNELRK